MTATDSQSSAVTTAPPTPLATVPLADLDVTSTLLSINDLDPNPWNSRNFAAHPDAEDQSLIESIRLQGVLENLLVRPKPDGRYEVVFGERRLRCARAAGRTTVPATIRALDDHQARVLTVTENLQRKDLHFLEEAEGIAGLFGEGWTLDMVASQLGRSRRWVARRKHLLNLTLSWSQLARQPESEPWITGWSAAHFEHISTLAPEAQEHLLATQPALLEACVTAADLAQLTRSLTLDLRSFPWKLDDGELDPEAGACSLCPHRTSHHPGLFDDQPADAPPPSGGRTRRMSGASAATDRCLNPQCAARKGNLFVEQTATALSAKHPTVLRLQEDWSGRAIPGAIDSYRVKQVTRRTPGAVPAVVASGAKLGAVRWVLPPTTGSATRPAPQSPARAAGKKPLTERRAMRDRQRKILALGLLHGRLLEAPAPDLATCVRLAIVFGTYQSLRSSGSVHDPSLPRLAPGATAATVSRRMLAALPRPSAYAPHPPIAGDPGSSTAGSPSPGLIGASVATPDNDPTALPGDNLHQHEDSDEPLDDDRFVSGSFVPGSQLWHTFDALAADETFHPDLLWARTLPVLLSRLTPLPDTRDIQLEWTEAERLAHLAGLNLHALFQLAVDKLPDPKSWAAEEAALAKAQAASQDSSTAEGLPTLTRDRHAPASPPRQSKKALPTAEPPAAA